MDEEPPKTDSMDEEVVFVLRVRPGRYGWQGQMQRLDGRVRSRLVAGTRDIYAQLEQDWRAASSDHKPALDDGAAKDSNADPE